MNVAGLWRLHRSDRSEGPHRLIAGVVAGGGSGVLPRGGSESHYTGAEALEIVAGVVLPLFLLLLVVLVFMPLQATAIFCRSCLEA